MEEKQFASTILMEFEHLSARLQEAARWVLDHPADVALLSTREQAKRAGLAPATFTRLGQRFGFDGYDDVRRIYAASVRQRPESFHGRAEELLARRDTEGDAALIQDTFAALIQHFQALSDVNAIERFTAAADQLASANRVFCLGFRAAFPVAFMLHYARSLFGSSSILADGAGATAVDALRAIEPGDALLAISVRPYTRLTVQAAQFARERGATVVALTDSKMSPLAKVAKELVLVRTDTPSFINSMTPAFAAAECLAALVAARTGHEALAALSKSGKQLAAFKTHLLPNKGRPVQK